ncbi:MAG: hypothetical protein Sapg2KO_30270 [Saprospiraceae bacterium]
MKTFYTLIALVFATSFTHAQISTTTQAYFDLIRPDFSGDLAYETTAYVAQFWRVAGNTGFNNSIQRIEDQLKAAGYILEENAKAEDRLIYRVETRPMERPTWEPVDAHLAIVGAKEPLLQFKSNRNMIYQNSASTPKEGVKAEVVFVESLDALKDLSVENKIVFAERNTYQLYNEAIVKGGALGMLTYNNPDYLQPQKNTTSIQFRGLRYNKEVPAWGIALSYAARETLKKALASGPVEVEVAIETKLYPSEELTIVAEVRGSELPKESLVFSAHVQEPGANDNASGVGAQLEMAAVTAKLIQEKKIDAKRSMVFLWGDEIISTRRYIQEKEKRNAEVNWGISLDMVGENTDLTGGTFLIEKMPDPSAIWTRGNDQHSEWGGRPLNKSDMTPHYLNDFIIQTFEAQGKHANWVVKTNPFEGGSDHTPFLDADLPGLLLWHFTDQFYHTDNDQIDKVSAATLRNVGTAALVSALTLVNADHNTAKSMVDLIVESANQRLETEFALSKAAVDSGALASEEIDILKTWKNWYKNTLSTTKDMVTNADKSLNKSIKKAQKKLDKKAEKLIIALRS